MEIENQDLKDGLRSKSYVPKFYPTSKTNILLEWRDRINEAATTRQNVRRRRVKVSKFNIIFN